MIGGGEREGFMYAINVIWGFLILPMVAESPFFLN